ncbi:hypothetical protein IFM58399_03557 [Aspergillus lentulus]|uniref:Aminoglycoside phosphotransferase domain-containing protein n=1 Tax=Aspergillus lentulus TaxID=293939 RepID=A0ABQ1AMN0_ASPLE|nr:uncharacterized protein IFM58399_03557 [Aspergillus lentulus]KAF4152540.1 hypothetical protein CNMCM6069_001972 [Aspergillus lentulus]KAF4170462.1 hypothetical protein CNMCM8060_005322 [Aspergillus lentulus]KAF4176036.1 hypothetical protein CNMCM7927_004439 [Aspergillus lentulus]KAF4188168.1 hypothetical protein CNMCM8694_004893 [Aspergillus lentulus]GFF33485.1 hypothetical protein IFM58399_03557 [Aspergillus lentulus]
MEGECHCEGADKDFPAGSVMRKFEKATFPIAGRLYRLKKILWERYNSDNHQRRAMFEAEECETKDPVVIKFFLEADPFMREEERGKRTMKNNAAELFRNECEIWRTLTDTGYTPKFYGKREMHQDLTFENPGGYLWILVLEHFPTFSLADAPQFLNADELPRIEKQLLDMAVNFNKHGLDYVGVSFLKFDPEKRRVYVTDIEYFRETEVRNDPVAAKNSARHWISVVMGALRAGVEEIRGLSPMDEYIDLEDLGHFGSDSD